MTTPIQCPHLHSTTCEVIRSICFLQVLPTPQTCEACTNHRTHPQRVNGVTCAAAYKAQKDAGLEPDEKLLNCIKTEEVLPQETLAHLRDMWARLHTMKSTPWKPDIIRKRYEWWRNELPIFGCDCGQHWDEIMEKHPLVYDSHMAYFHSTWLAHNKVNERLFKETVSFDAAVLHWDHYMHIKYNKRLFQ